MKLWENFVPVYDSCVKSLNLLVQDMYMYARYKHLYFKTIIPITQVHVLLFFFYKFHCNLIKLHVYNLIQRSTKKWNKIKKYNVIYLIFYTEPWLSSHVLQVTKIQYCSKDKQTHASSTRKPFNCKYKEADTNITWWLGWVMISIKQGYREIDHECWFL